METINQAKFAPSNIPFDVVMGDDKIAPGDCRLEWADGGMIRDSSATAALIDEANKRNTTALHRCGEKI